jgi:hypothetical protein
LNRRLGKNKTITFQKKKKERTAYKQEERGEICNINE